jgi:hypothetical protein
VKLLLDAHYSPAIAEQLRARTLPRSARAIGRHVRALEKLLSAHPDADALADTTVWIG